MKASHLIFLLLLHLVPFSCRESNKENRHENIMSHEVSSNEEWYVIRNSNLRSEDLPVEPANHLVEIAEVWPLRSNIEPLSRAIYEEVESMDKHCAIDIRLGVMVVQSNLQDSTVVKSIVIHVCEENDMRRRMEAE